MLELHDMDCTKSGSSECKSKNERLVEVSAFSQARRHLKVFPSPFRNPQNILCVAYLAENDSKGRAWAGVPEPIAPSI